MDWRKVSNSTNNTAFNHPTISKKRFLFNSNKEISKQAMWTEIGNTFGYDQHKHGKQKKWGQHEIYVFDPDHVGVSFMFNPHPTRSSSSPTFNFKQTYIWSAGVPLRQPFQNFLEMSSDSNQKSCLG